MIRRRHYIHTVCRLGKTNDINMYILYLLVTFFQFSSEINKKKLCYSSLEILHKEHSFEIYRHLSYSILRL